MRPLPCMVFFFFNDTATTEIYTLSLHDALPISRHRAVRQRGRIAKAVHMVQAGQGAGRLFLELEQRSEEHTSELQSHSDLVCRLLLEKKKKTHTTATGGLPREYRT